MKELETTELFDLSHSMAGKSLAGFTYPWEALPYISEMVFALGAALSSEEYDMLDGNIWIAKDAKIAESASITGPCIIGRKTEVRVGAFIRGSVLVGEGAVVGNSCELKNCILFDGVQVPHFNYVGDSILGYKAHLGAGAVTSNIKSDRTNVAVRIGKETIPTGLRKMGAMVGDFVEVGCNSVLNPGTVIGRESTLYPLSSVRGFVPSRRIYKSSGMVAVKEKRGD